MPVHEIESTFLDVIEGTVLHPDFIDQLVDEVFADNPDAERVALGEDRKRLACEIENLTKAIAAGGDIPALAAALSERDKRLKVVNARLAKPTIAPPDREVLRAALQLREGQWREVLRSRHILQARFVLQHLINLPIKILNQAGPSYIKKGDTRGTENIKWTAQTRPGGMLFGLVQKMWRPQRGLSRSGHAKCLEKSKQRKSAVFGVRTRLVVSRRLEDNGLFHSGVDASRPRPV
jgi:hypothetical protein